MVIEGMGRGRSMTELGLAENVDRAEWKLGAGEPVRSISALKGEATRNGEFDLCSSNIGGPRSRLRRGGGEEGGHGDSKPEPRGFEGDGSRSTAIVSTRVSLRTGCEPRAFGFEEETKERLG